GGGADVGPVLDLAGVLPNLCGVILDDYFGRVIAGASGEDPSRAGPEHAARFASRAAEAAEASEGPFSVSALRGLRARLRSAARPLDLWVVLYTHELGWGPLLGPHLEWCDVVTWWTWKVSDLAGLEDHFARFEDVVGDRRKVLGVYLW